MKQLHPSIVVKEFIVKENEAFRLRINKWKCTSPADLNALEFVQESLQDGKVVGTSTYNFSLTDDDIKVLTANLAK